MIKEKAIYDHDHTIVFTYLFIQLPQHLGER